LIALFSLKEIRAGENPTNFAGYHEMELDWKILKPVTVEWQDEYH